MRSLVLLASLVFSAPLAAQGLPDPAVFATGEVNVGGRAYPYRLLEPLPQQRATPQPLVVFLHGSGERGNDNLQQLRWLPQSMAEPTLRMTRPCYLLAVQCPAGEQWTGAPLDAVEAAMAAVLARPGIDAARVYLTGLSMGGFGAFELAMRCPDRFAAVLAICGGGNPGAAAQLLGMPLQVWHGSADAAVPVERSRQMVAALQALGVEVDYHELPGKGHDVWSFAYGEGDALSWLFAQDLRQQRRGPYAQPAILPACEFYPAGGQFTMRPGARCFADENARPAAQLWLDAWQGPVVMRPGLVASGLVASGNVRAGDFVFALDARLPVAYELTIDAWVTVKARDAAQLGRAAAATVQAMKTWPGGSCPTGRVVRSQPTPGGQIVFGASPVAWPNAALERVLREAWLFGATEISFAGKARPDGCSDGDWSRLQVDAERRGIGFVAAAPAWQAPSQSGHVQVPDGAVAVVLGAPRLGGPVRFLLPLEPAAPDVALATLQWRLPAAAEWAQQLGGTVHIASFWSRLGALRRRS